MKNKVKLLSFFTAFLFAFGITSLDFDNLALDNNIKGYTTVALGFVAAIAYMVLRKKEKENN